MKSHDLRTGYKLPNNYEIRLGDRLVSKAYRPVIVKYYRELQRYFVETDDDSKFQFSLQQYLETFGNTSEWRGSIITE